MIFCEKRKRREDAPFFRFFEARSGATQRGKSKKGVFYRRLQLAKRL